MKKIIFKFSKYFLAAALVIGKITASSPCIIEFYQPPIPNDLR